MENNVSFEALKHLAQTTGRLDAIFSPCWNEADWETEGVRNHRRHSYLTGGHLPLRSGGRDVAERKRQSRIIGELSDGGLIEVSGHSRARGLRVSEFGDQIARFLLASPSVFDSICCMVRLLEIETGGIYQESLGYRFIPAWALALQIPPWEDGGQPTSYQTWQKRHDGQYDIAEATTPAWQRGWLIGNSDQSGNWYFALTPLGRLILDHKTPVPERFDLPVEPSDKEFLEFIEHQTLGYNSEIDSFSDSSDRENNSIAIPIRQCGWTSEAIDASRDWYLPWRKELLAELGGKQKKAKKIAG